MSLGYFLAILTHTSLFQSLLAVAAAFSPTHACHVTWKTLPVDQVLRDRTEFDTQNRDTIFLQTASDAICQKSAIRTDMQRSVEQFQLNFFHEPSLHVKSITTQRAGRASFLCCNTENKKTAKCINGEFVSAPIQIGNASFPSSPSPSSRVIMVSVRQKTDIETTLPWLLASIVNVGICADIVLLVRSDYFWSNLLENVCAGFILVVYTDMNIFDLVSSSDIGWSGELIFPLFWFHALTQITCFYTHIVVTSWKLCRCRRQCRSQQSRACCWCSSSLFKKTPTLP